MNKAWQVLYFAAMGPPGGGRNFITPRVARRIFTVETSNSSRHFGVVHSHCWITGRYYNSDLVGYYMQGPNGVGRCWTIMSESCPN